jgi:energy-coupling factor transporter ATP-binding protein EcfA2
MTEQPLNLPSDLSLLLYGDTGHGKSTLIAQLAVELAKQGKRTAVFLADKGSLKPFKLLAKHRVVDLYRPQGNAWLWVHHALRGEVRNAQGKYQSVTDLEPHTGLIVHEGLTAYAELLMSGLAEMSANGTNVGGEGAWNITIREDKDTLKLGTSNRAHYGAVQLQIREGMHATKPPVPHIFTAGVRRGESGQNTPVLGPLVVGEALTSQLPRWVDYTFRCTMTGGKYHLHLSPHADPQLGPRTVALSNARLPLQGGSVTVPPSIEPASLVKALRILQAREDAAERELTTQLKKEKA